MKQLYNLKLLWFVRIVTLTEVHQSSPNETRPQVPLLLISEQHWLAGNVESEIAVSSCGRGSAKSSVLGLLYLKCQGNTKMRETLNSWL